MRHWVAVGLFVLLPVVVRGQDAGRFTPPGGDHGLYAKAEAARMMMERCDPGDGAGLRPKGAADTDVMHYHLDIELDPASAWLGGSNTMTVRSLVDDLTVFHFRLHEVFNISELRVGDVPVTWVQVDEATVEVTLDRPYDTDEVFELYVAYDGYPESEGSWGSITFRYRGGYPEVYTLSQPWYAYTWWPAKDDLMDKTTAELWFTVPDTMVVASNGVLLGIDNVDPDKLRYRWKTEYQTEDYLYCLGATNYDTFGTDWEYNDESMPLEFFIYPEDNTPSNREAWLRTTEMLTVYSDLYGLYPFVDEKYGMLQCGFGGGMEHQTMTSQGGFWEYITAHELSHQWWGDNVTCATWHDIWLNEGFATYSEALWYENMPGSPGEPWLHEYMTYRRPSDVNGTVYRYDISSQAQIFEYDFTYLKAAWVVHMLRHVVGDDMFYDLLGAYRVAFEGGAATTDDFQNVAEAVAGRDLSWFFEPWVYEAGAPKYRYAWRLHVLDGVGYVELLIRQMQMYTLFPMPIDIETTGSLGTQTHVVWNDELSEHLLWGVESPDVSDLVFDPKPWILWTSASTLPFIEGPPKIVTMSPAPDEVVESSEVSAIEIVFHKDVVVDETEFSLVGTHSGPVPVTFWYDEGRYAVTLALGAALVSDTYTLTVADSIVDVEAGKELDGELTKPHGGDPLPSGDGLPGGPAVAQFIVTLVGDLDCNGDIDFGDINPFVLALSDPNAYQAAYPGCPIQNADVNGDGIVDFEDINPFVALLSGS